MPFLNCEKYIQDSIRSVLAQSYSRWELLLVDDGSTDGSTQIARLHSELYRDKITYLEHPRHENLGASASRNLGARAAKGSHIAYLDADDLWVPHKLEQQVKLLSKYPDVDMIIGATKYWYSWATPHKEGISDNIIQVGAPQNRLFEPGQLLARLYPFGQGAAPSVNTILIRANLLERIGGWEDSFRVAYTDQAFLVKVYLTATVYVSEEWWDWYRQRSDSSSHTALAGGRKRIVRLQFLQWFEKYILLTGQGGFYARVLLVKAMLHYRYPGLARLWSAGRSRIGVKLRGISW